MTTKTLLSKARALPVRERAALIDELWASFTDEELATTSDWFSEADLREWNRRSDELDAHPELALSWEQMKNYEKKYYSSVRTCSFRKCQ
jgi:putative addiction module component (TIGR02574 family)